MVQTPRGQGALTSTRWALKGLAIAILLSGCAAQRVFNEGQELLSRGQASEAMEKLSEASRLQPTSAEYRAAYLVAKARSQKELMDQAQQSLKQGQLAEAERDFGRALAQDPAESRALSGLRMVDAARRQEKWLKDAEVAMRAKDMDLARGRVRAVLLEQPDHPAALKLMSRLEASSGPELQATEAVLAGGYRKPISIEFKDTPLKTIFEVLSRTSGMNFLLDKDVRTDQKTSIFLKNSTVEAAVNLTLLTNQLEQRILDANTVLIFPSTAAKLKDYQPLVVRSFYLSNADVKSVANTIKTILKSRDVIVDEKLNLLIMRDSPAAIRMAEKLVALHDVPEAEVMLEVEILEVKRSRLLDLGVRWPDQLSLTPLPSTSGGALTVNQLRALNGNTVGATLGATTINAKKQDTDANILANPRIRARNKEKAKILIGEKVPNITTTATSTGFISDSVTYVDVGLKLDVEPTIYQDEEVAIKVSLEVSNIVSQVQTKSGTLAYQIGTRVAQTVLRLKDGENQVLAGLINDEDRRSAYKVPAFGEVPILGRLFGSQLDDNTKTEIVLSITPRIIRSLQRPSAEMMEFDSGTESNLSSRVLLGLAAASKEPVAASKDARAVSPARSAGNLVVVQPQPPAQAVPSSTVKPVDEPLDRGAAVAAPAGLKLAWSGPAQVRPGQRFDVVMSADVTEGVSQVPLAIAYDPAVLKVVQVSEAGFMKQADGKASFSSNLNNKGRAMMVVARTEGTAKGQGDLIRLTLEATASTALDTRLDVISASPAAPEGRLIETRLPDALVLHVKP